jgi:hypothetical protein
MNMSSLIHELYDGGIDNIPSKSTSIIVYYREIAGQLSLTRSHGAAVRARMVFREMALIAGVPNVERAIDD